LTATALPSSSQLIGSYPPLLLLPPFPMSSSSSSISREDVVMKQSAKDEENPDSRPQVAKERLKHEALTNRQQNTLMNTKP
jgi:hypothetical protein